MPEMPELEGVADFLRRTVVGARIAEVGVAAISAVKTADPPITDVVGHRVDEVLRRGKWLLLRVDAAPPVHIGFHLSRAGWLVWRATPPARPVGLRQGPLAIRITFVDDDGTLVGAADLTEAGTQKRLAVHVVRRPDDIPAVARLGPDPLADGVSLAQLRDILHAQGGRHLKSALRDQTVLAGIGNAYSDEILHAARLSPAARCDALDDDQTAALHAAAVSVLTAAVQRAVGHPPSALKDGKRSTMAVHGRTGSPCPVCGDTIAGVASADSSYQYCPTCQTGGRRLADRRMSRLLK
jgi:formamidopyrimidine-DNA glycosylase